MKIVIYYHLREEPNWIPITIERTNLLEKHLLTNACEKIIFLYHGSSEGKSTIEKELNAQNFSCDIEFWENPVKETGGCSAAYSCIKIWEDCQHMQENIAIFHFNNKGITHINSDYSHINNGWTEYIHYWFVEKWKLCYQALVDGYEMSGANWHWNIDHEHGHWSGSIWWTTSDYIKKLPRMTDPHLIGFQKQYSISLTPRHDHEIWVGFGRPKKLELHHYRHAVVYNVLPPNPEEYRL